jgi:glycosyltransferase involved in cell wall biosynthesis
MQWLPEKKEIWGLTKNIIHKYIVFVSINIKKDGAEKSLISLQTYLNREKKINTLTIIPSHGPIEELLKENGIEYIIHSFKGNINAGRGTKPFRGIVKTTINIIQARKLAKVLKKRKLNIVGVHSNTITSEFGCFLAERLRVPHIWHIREFGKLDFNFDFELGIGYIKRCASKASKIICNSKAVMTYYQQFFKDNLTYVYNGVSAVPQGERDWNNKTFKMVLAGRLSEEKGQTLAIEACRKLRASGCDDFQLDFYGNGVDEEKLINMIAQYDLNDHIHLCGYSNKIPFSSYHVGLMCSHHEAFGRVTVEYMVNEIPVIGIDSGGTPEIVEDGVDGIMCESIDDLFQAMRELYSDRKKCISMGQAGRKRALEQFTLERYCENIYKIYEEVLLK